MSYSQVFFQEAARIAGLLDHATVDRMADELVAVRDRGGRLFLLGVGGSAGNCGHAVNDFRKLCGIETYAPTDNVSELTARTNDEGWDTVFAAWLRVSRLRAGDAVMVFSVGGGDAERNVSANIVAALKLAQAEGATILGVVGRSTGYTAQVGTAVVVVPVGDASKTTPFAEAFQGVVWHCLVSNPKLQIKGTMWESVLSPAPAP